MYVLIIIAAVLFAIMLLKLRVFAEYNEHGFSGFAKIAFVKIRFPGDKKSERKSDTAETEKKRGGSIGEFKKIMKPLFSALKKLIKTIKIKKLCADIKIASDDAFNTAMMYGGAAAAVGVAVPWIENNLRVEKKEITAVADFESTESTVYFSADMTIAVWQILVILIRLAYQIIKEQKFDDNKNDVKEKGRKKDGRACIK